MPLSVATELTIYILDIRVGGRVNGAVVEAPVLRKRDVRSVTSVLHQFRVIRSRESRERERAGR